MTKHGLTYFFDFFFVFLQSKASKKLNVVLQQQCQQVKKKWNENRCSIVMVTFVYIQILNLNIGSKEGALIEF